MADIELVIKIDEEQYEHIKHMTMYEVKDYHALMYDICERIKNGTLLPKGHGRLIDADAINRKDVNCANVPMNFIDTAHTIIEADKENTE